MWRLVSSGVGLGLMHLCALECRLWGCCSPDGDGVQFKGADQEKSCGKWTWSNATYGVSPFPHFFLNNPVLIWSFIYIYIIDCNMKIYIYIYIYINHKN